MNLTDRTVRDFLGLLSSEAPAPGGGSAAALCGAQGAALCAMVAALTLGRKKYEAEQALCAEVRAEAEGLRARLTGQIDADTEAFGLVTAALALPKETDEEKAARRQALVRATVEAARVPLETLELTTRALAQAVRLIGHSNRNCASDLAVAGLCLRACAEGCWRNVEINLSGIDDPALVTGLRTRGERALAEARRMADELAQ